MLSRSELLEFTNAQFDRTNINECANLHP